MKQFKKRTLALVLASVITVVGAFGEENYKNSLMSLKFEGSENGHVLVVLQTDREVTNNISPIRQGATTYVVTLPETISRIPQDIPLGPGIINMNVETIPYTTKSNGYTKLTFDTEPNIYLGVRAERYIASRETAPALLEDSSMEDDYSTQTAEEDTGSEPSRYSSNTIHSQSGVDQVSPVDINESLKQFEAKSPRRSNIGSGSELLKDMKTMDDLAEEEKPSKHTEALYIILGVAFVIVTSIFLMLKAKDKLVEITGEKANYDVSDDSKKKKDNKSSKQKINTTINNIDKKYTRPATMPVSAPPPKDIHEEPEEETVQEVANVVDLDELLKEHSNVQPNNDYFPENSVNSALEDFLSDFNFEDESDDEENEEKKDIDRELYDKCINDDNLEFSKDDVDRIGTLMGSEISDDTRRHAPEFLESSEKNKKPSPLEILEKMVTTYITQQNISFTGEDIDALYKLINVELDEDFITDLRTNPSRMQEMQDEIARQKAKPHKTSELLTLNVKDMLPDLSEALKKQGGRRIESEVKPQVVYFSEGYDVSTLKLNMELPDLSKEINNEEAYKVRPSDDIQYVDTSYEVQKMSIANELPDLEDMLKHPEKYETPEPEPVEVDEEALLRNITNVTFKPFDDGTRQFEILNDLPTVSDMQEEFNQFGDNFEIINDDEEEDLPEIKETDKNDFETLYDGKYVDLDKDIKQHNAQEQTLEPESNSTVNNTIQVSGGVPKEPQAKPAPVPKKVSNTGNSDSEADKLLSKIKTLENQRKAKMAAKQTSLTPNKTKPELQKPIPEFCLLDGERFEIVNASYFTDKMGCYLAKNGNGYCILGFAGDNVFKIKYYEKLDTEKLQSRISERLEDGTMRYIIRIGIHKFILNVKQNDMEFVMDLC